MVRKSIHSIACVRKLKIEAKIAHVNIPLRSICIYNFVPRDWHPGVWIKLRRASRTNRSQSKANILRRRLTWVYCIHQELLDVHLSSLITFRNSAWKCHQRKSLGVYGSTSVILKRMRSMCHKLIFWCIFIMATV